MSHVLGVIGLAVHKNEEHAAEQALLAQCKRQDYDAFSRVLDVYQARVYGFVRRMVPNDDEAQDVTQEVFIRAYQAMGTFDGRSSLRSWLFRIAHNLCIDKARRRERQVSTMTIESSQEDEQTYEFADTRWDPSQSVLTDELREVVEGAISTMSEKLRTVLLLHDKEDMGYEEIAKTIDVPVGTVKSRLFLARNHLQQVVGNYLYGGAR